MGKLNKCASDLCYYLGDKDLTYETVGDAEAFMAEAREIPLLAKVPMFLKRVKDKIVVVVKESAPKSTYSKLSTYRVDSSGVLYSE